MTNSENFSATEGALDLVVDRDRLVRAAQLTKPPVASFERLGRRHSTLLQPLDGTVAVRTIQADSTDACTVWRYVGVWGRSPQWSVTRLRPEPYRTHRVLHASLVSNHATISILAGFYQRGRR